MRRRSLALRRELLTELATSDLAGVAGANQDTKTVTTKLYTILPVEGCIIIVTGLPCGGPPGSQMQCAGS
jgi:hypothetical protein